jgi:hypothetical protein
VPLPREFHMSNRQLRVATNPASFKAAGIDITDDLRAEYEEFCEECRRDLDPIESEYGGVPTFTEWKLTYREKDHG